MVWSGAKCGKGVKSDFTLFWTTHCLTATQSPCLEPLEIHKKTLVNQLNIAFKRIWSRCQWKLSHLVGAKVLILDVDKISCDRHI